MVDIQIKNITEKESLEAEVNQLKRRIPYLKELIRTKRLLMELKE